MTDYVNDYLAKHKARIRASGQSGYVVPQLFCADGTKLSVQASRGHYCFPREDDGPWSHVEVWCVYGPSGRDVRVPSFGNDHDNPYAYVPVELVNKFIHRHGGIKED